MKKCRKVEENKVSDSLQKSELLFFQNEKNENNIKNMVGNAFLKHIFGDIPGIELLGNSSNYHFLFWKWSKNIPGCCYCCYYFILENDKCSKNTMFISLPLSYPWPYITYYSQCIDIISLLFLVPIDGSIDAIA